MRSSSKTCAARCCSGHGLQQAPAVGRGLAEWIADGAYTSLDLSPLSVQRLVEGRALVEKNVI